GRPGCTVKYTGVCTSGGSGNGGRGWSSCVSESTWTTLPSSSVITVPGARCTSRPLILGEASTTSPTVGEAIAIACASSVRVNQIVNGSSSAPPAGTSVPISNCP